MPAPLYPDASWFTPPEDGIPTDKRFTITDEGRVYGYVSLWASCHAGMSGCVRPPRNGVSEHAHQGETITASGESLKTAVIAGGTVHAAIEANDPAEHYMNTGKQLMRVRYGEDETGLWFAGALMPDATDFDVAHIRASSLSGDWRWHAAWRKGADGYEFMGSCLVNIPGYPIGSSAIGSQSGRRFAMTASASGETIMMDEVLAGAIASHSTQKADPDTPWDGPNSVAKVPSESEALRRMHAWVDPNGDPDAKSSYKLPHHISDGRVVLRGVQAAMSRLMQADTQIPDSDRPAVYEHLARHYRQFDLEPPEFHIAASADENEQCDECEGEVINEEFEFDAHFDELLAAMTSFSDKRKKKNKKNQAEYGSLTADGTEEVAAEAPEEEGELSQLLSALTIIADRVNDLETTVYSAEATRPVE